MKKMFMFTLVVVLILCGGEMLISATGTDGESPQIKTREQLLEEFERKTFERLAEPDELWLKENEGRVVEESNRNYVGIRSIGDVESIKGNVIYAETGHGAHYYAYSPQTTNYKTATGFFELPTSLNVEFDTEAPITHRSAYISAGILGSTHGIDLGIRNTGGRWHPYYYDGYREDPDDPSDDGKNVYKAFDEEESEQAGYVAEDTAVCAAFLIMPYTETSVVFSVTFYDENDECVGDFLKIIPVVEDNLIFSNSQALCRFFRFVSLVQPDGYVDNQMDSTYMLDAGFSELSLSGYDASMSGDWGIDSNRVECAWLVSPERIQFEYWQDSETVSIDHWSE